ncbi:MAG: VanZ family protein [Phycisphaerae bacterium]|nr:VanZ family protein [Phycisphaerae bacterium]MDD5380263.1 VanZ family protein [Phycisphaerae bacterium]
MALIRRPKLTIISLLLYWPGIFILAHIPIPQVVYRAGVSDKSLHFLVYLILVFLLWFAISPDKKVNWRRAAVWWVLFVVVWYGVVDEVLQKYVGRSCDVMDFIADLTGTLAGLVLFSFFTFWPVALVVAGTTIFTVTNFTRANLADLVPITNAMFNLFGYGFFTMLWIQNISIFLRMKAPKFKWIITALALPLCFLLTVRLFSVIFGKDFGVKDIIVAVAGITAVVATTYLIALCRKGVSRAA